MTGQPDPQAGGQRLAALALLSLSLGFCVNFLGEPMPWQDWVRRQFAGHGDGSRLERHAAGVVAQVVVPWLLSLVLLNLLRFERWLVMTRLGLGACMIASLVIAGVTWLALYRASQDLPPYLSKDMLVPVRAVLVASLVLGLGSTMLATLRRGLPRQLKRRVQVAWRRINAPLKWSHTEPATARYAH